jgi:predicted dehydrogenase
MNAVTQQGANRREFIKVTALTAAGAWVVGSAATSSVSASESSDAPAPPAPDGTVGAQGGGQQVPLAPPDKQPPDLKVPEPVKRKVGWAVVGLGELALEEVMPAFREAKLSEPVALVSGHPEKARKVAEVYGIDPQNIYDYQNYDRLAENRRVEVVYVILPNSMHAEYTARGLKAGKHVLCEKPMAVTVAESERMIAVAREARRKLMIAYRLHYEPYNQKVMELSRQKAYGELKTFSSSNTQDVKAPNIRLSKALGGGPVGDVGVYCINTARYVINEEPVEVTAYEHRPADDPRFREVPETVVFTLRYPSGVIAHCECGFGHARSERYRVVGSKGYVEMDPAFGYRGQRLFLMEQGEGQGGGRKSELKLEPVNQFAAEMDHFSECVLNDTEPRTPGELGLADMRIVEAVHEAARTGRPARVGR